jgi:hypothetical protein
MLMGYNERWTFKRWGFVAHCLSMHVLYGVGGNAIVMHPAKSQAKNPESNTGIDSPEMFQLKAIDRI